MAGPSSMTTTFVLSTMPIVLNSVKFSHFENAVRFNGTDTEKGIIGGLKHKSKVAETTAAAETAQKLFLAEYMQDSLWRETEKLV